ncbi:MAG: hypothetical protein Q8S57_00005, partial [Methanoregula sp.]|nr:hypothetical protein [Methanoregula sp.]
FTVEYQLFLNFTQFPDVLLLSNDNLLRNTLQARISNSFWCNILEGATGILFKKGLMTKKRMMFSHQLQNASKKIRQYLPVLLHNS